MAELELLDSRQWTPTKSLSRKELQDEVELWRTIWGWHDEETKQYLSQIGQMTQIIERNYHAIIGTLLQPTFTLKSIEIGTVEKAYSQATGQYYFEKKRTIIPASNIVKTEFIQQRTLEEGIEASALEELVSVIGEA